MPYTAAQVGLTAPSGSFQNGGWYGGRQFWNGQFGEVNQIINPNQQGSGQQVSQAVQNQSAAAQGVTPQQFGNYLTQQAQKANTPAPQTLTSQGQSNGGTPNASGTPSTASSGTTSPDVNSAQQAVKNIQDQITAKQQAAADAIKNENDNPFYSESTRVGRIAKINDALNADLAPLTQQLTDAQSAYDTAVKANTPDNQVVQSVDNNGNVTLTTIDKKTGNIVSQQVEKGIGKVSTSSSKATVSDALSQMQQIILNHLNSYGNISPKDWQKALNQWIGQGLSEKDFVDNFGHYADINRGDFASAYGFKNPTPQWSTAYPGHRIGTVFTDSTGNRITVTK